MGERTEYAAGTFCWPELATSDLLGAKKFYDGLFGWSPNDMPMEGGGVYTRLVYKGKNIGAMYKLMDEQTAQGVPPHWLSYISVAKVDESLEKAKSLGATLIAGPYNAGEAGRMAVLSDPTGAAFALWQANQNIGAELVNETNTFCWNELATKDSAAATDFYCQLFGWTISVQEMEGGNYTQFMNGDQLVGGMMQISEEWGDVPAHWAIYFSVEDCDKAAEKVVDLGGKILLEPQDIPDIGRFAVVNDPQGANFSIIQLTQVDP